MNIIDLDYVQAAARWRSLARAANEIGIDTSTISRRIGRLEDELGILLFERARGGLRLTPAGSEVLSHAERARAEFDAIKSVGQDGGRGNIGSVRFGIRMALMSEPLGTLLGEWKNFAPMVEVTIVESLDDDFAFDLEERRIDIGLVPTHILWPHAATCPLYRERLVAVIPPDHRLARQETLKWSDLAGDSVLIQGRDGGRLQREFLTKITGRGMKFKSHRASEQTLFSLVANGFGATISCESHAKKAPAGVIWRTIDEVNASIENSLVWLPELEDAAIGRFVAFMRDKARSGGFC